MVYVSWPQPDSIARRYWAQSPWYLLRAALRPCQDSRDAGATRVQPRI